MPNRTSGGHVLPRIRLALFVVLPAIAALLLGSLACGRIDVREDSSRINIPALSGLAEASGEETHDLAITAIDFDPALRPGARLETDNITLLVATDNKGNQVEHNSIIEATLLGLPDLDVLVSSQVSIKEIAPGESQVVRFSNFSSIPLRSAYSLRVEIPPVPGEIALSNNSRSYRLEVTVSSR